MCLWVASDRSIRKLSFQEEQFKGIEVMSGLFKLEFERPIARYTYEITNSLHI